MREADSAVELKRGVGGEYVFHDEQSTLSRETKSNFMLNLSSKMNGTKK